MRFTAEQALVFEKDSGNVRGSITTHKWPNAELAYVIDRSLCKFFRSPIVHCNDDVLKGGSTA